MSDEQKTETPVSPTGAPYLPQWFIKLMVPLVAAAGVVGFMPDEMKALGAPLVVISIAKILFALGSALGLASQGARK